MKLRLSLAVWLHFCAVLTVAWRITHSCCWTSECRLCVFARALFCAKPSADRHMARCSFGGRIFAQLRPGEGRREGKSCSRRRDAAQLSIDLLPRRMTHASATQLIRWGCSLGGRLIGCSRGSARERERSPRCVEVKANNSAAEFFLFQICPPTLSTLIQQMNS